MGTAFIQFHEDRIAWKVEGGMSSGDEVEPLPSMASVNSTRLLTIEESKEIALAAVIKKMVSQYKPDTIRLTYQKGETNAE